LQKVLDKGDILDGKVVSQAHLGRLGLNSNQIAMAVVFEDRSSGIYIATPIPEPTTIALLVPAFGLLAICVRAARKSAATR
jgi:hypothetical protein